MRSSLYSCTVYHRRTQPRVYGFSTRMFMWHLDLAEIDELAQNLPLLSRNRRNVYTFRDDDHLYLGRETLAENVRAYLKQEGVEAVPARISLLTNLRTFGYVFNPVSFYFCEDASGEPLAVVVEVHNTFGELKPFLLRREDLSRSGFRKTYPKLFYISPFSELDQRLEIRVRMPDDRLSIQVNNYAHGEKRPFFRSALTGQAKPLSSASMAAYTLRFPLVTLKVITLIHWHALKLYLKRVPFYRKSNQPHLQKGILPKKGQSLN